MNLAGDGKNRTKPSTAIYRAVMESIEARRVELGVSMATVNDMAGTQDGFYCKMIYPDTPHGRQARWETVQDVVEALFGRGFSVQIVPDEAENARLRSAPRIEDGASANALKTRHWRHTRHFQELGRLGAKALHAKRTPAERSKLARHLNKIRWKRQRAKEHKRANEEAMAQ